MGIRGMHALVVKKLNSVCKPIKLQNTHLVLDGNNLCRMIFKESCDSVKFSGNYEPYYEYSKTFFLNLKRCNIIPIVLWDGIHEDRELTVLIERWKSKVRQLKYGIQNCFLNFDPLLLYEVLMDVINELGIMHFTCLTEADKEAAIIAHILNCPVLTYDSDFYFFNIQYIAWQNIDLKLKQNETDNDYYLDCFIFDRAAFLSELKLNFDIFLMIPVLLGQSHFQNNLFENFFNRIFPSRKMSLKNVLSWMKKVGSFDCAIKDILVDTKSCEQEKMMKVICDVYEYFKIDEKPISPYIKVSKTEPKIEIDYSIEPNMLPKEHCLSKFSQYMIRLYIQHVIPHVLMRVNSDSITFSPITWEDFNEPSSSNISLPILSGQLQIVKRILGLNTVEKMLIRKKTDPNVVLMYNSENFLLGITSEIFTAKVEERKNVLFEIVDFAETEKRIINEIGSDWSVFIISIIYWMKNRRYHMNPKTVGKTKLEAVVMTALAIHAGNVMKNNKQNGESMEEGEVPSVARQVANITNAELSVFATNFSSLQTENPEIPYSISTVHGLVLFQSCLCQIRSLNNFLNQPFPTLKVHEFLCGILTHSVSELMKDSHFEDIAFLETPNLRKLYCYLMGKIREALDYSESYCDVTIS